MEIWWQNYWIVLLFSIQHTNRLDFLVPIFFKIIKSSSSTFQGKFPIFKADWKIKHFSRQHSNSSTFQGLWEPCIYVIIGSGNGMLPIWCQVIIWTNIDLLSARIWDIFQLSVIPILINFHAIKYIWKCHLQNINHFVRDPMCLRQKTGRAQTVTFRKEYMAKNYSLDMFVFFAKVMPN